jgi:hypothetical protein
MIGANRARCARIPGATKTAGDLNIALPNPLRMARRLRKDALWQAGLTTPAKML